MLGPSPIRDRAGHLNSRPSIKLRGSGRGYASGQWGKSDQPSGKQKSFSCDEICWRTVAFTWISTHLPDHPEVCSFCLIFTFPSWLTRYAQSQHSWSLVTQSVAVASWWPSLFSPTSDAWALDKQQQCTVAAREEVCAGVTHPHSLHPGRGLGNEGSTSAVTLTSWPFPRHEKGETM